MTNANMAMMWNMTMAKKNGSHLRTSLANAIKGQNMAIEKLREVDDPRDPKGRKWTPIEDWAKRRGYRWIAIGERPKERIWISIEVDDGN